MIVFHAACAFKTRLEMFCQICQDMLGHLFHLWHLWIVQYIKFVDSQPLDVTPLRVAKMTR